MQTNGGALSVPFCLFSLLSREIAFFRGRTPESYARSGREGA